MLFPSTKASSKFANSIIKTIIHSCILHFHLQSQRNDQSHLTINLSGAIVFLMSAYYVWIIVFKEPCDIPQWQGYTIMHSIYHVARVTSHLGKHIIVLLVCNEDTTRQQDLKWWASRFLGLKSSWMHLNNVMRHGELHVKLRVYHAWPSQCRAIGSSSTFITYDVMFSIHVVYDFVEGQIRRLGFMTFT